jgi:hypothetical protein
VKTQGGGEKCKILNVKVKLLISLHFTFDILHSIFLPIAVGRRPDGGGKIFGWMHQRK